MGAFEGGLIFKDEVYRIVGAAMEVSNTLGCGFLEGVYQEAMSIELAERSIPYVNQHRIEVYYRNWLLEKAYVVDFLCFERILVEIKAIKAITAIEEAQILNYLKATNQPLGLILNFGGLQLEWKRYARTGKMGPTRSL